MCATLGGCILDDPRAAGVVVVDEQALAAGVTLEQHAQRHGASALPWLADADDPVTVRSGESERTFMVDHGELVHVRGAELALARHLLDRDVARDRLELVAPAEVAQEIALLTSGQLTQVGEVGEDAYRLELANAFVHLAQLDASEMSALSEVRPIVLPAATAVPVDRAGLAAGSAAGAAGSPTSAVGDLRDLDRVATALLPGRERAPGAETVPDPVGVYRCGDDVLTLDAANRFQSCTLGKGRYEQRGRQLTIMTVDGPVTFELDRTASLVGCNDLRCVNAVSGGEP